MITQINSSNSMYRINEQVPIKTLDGQEHVIQLKLTLSDSIKVDVLSKRFGERYANAYETYSDLSDKELTEKIINIVSDYVNDMSVFIDLSFVPDFNEKAALFFDIGTKIAEINKSPR